MTISRAGNRLFLDEHLLCPLSDDEFFGQSRPMRVGFKRNEANEVLGMRVGDPQMQRRYWKVA